MRATGGGWWRGLCAALLAVAALCRTAAAQEALAEEEAPPTSVEKSGVAMDRAYEAPEERTTLRDAVRGLLKDAPPFFRDAKLSLYLRTYYRYFDGYGTGLSEAWAIGGGLGVKSGYLLERFAVGAVLYTSQPLYAPDDRDGTSLLGPGQEGYTVLGQLYGEFRITDGILIDLYRQTYNTPYINRNDSRMTPNTFEGYNITGHHGGEEGEAEVSWGAGYIAKIKERNSDEFVWMSQDIGAAVKRGVIAAGGRWSRDDTSLGLIEYFCQDVINIVYAEGKHSFEIREGPGILFAAQFTQQASTGDDLLTGASFQTFQLGFKGEVSHGGALLSLAYTTTGSGAAIRNPWSSCPGYTSCQLLDFNREGEQAFLVKAVYDFGNIGLAGVTFYALYCHGWDREDGFDEDEVDLDLQWRPTKESLKGLSIRVRWAYVWERGGADDTQQDLRVIVNWDF
ncbi:MAG TPA: OprD family outer membrane porin [Candidatus Eisenbacteria bacterium]|nr:OprD family outer membrane porin [Candidatus Eisenbacteria bacterium]